MGSSTCCCGVDGGGDVLVLSHCHFKAPTELALKIAIASPEDTTLQAQYHLYTVAGKKSFTYL